MQEALQDLACAVIDAEIVAVVDSEFAAIKFAGSHTGSWQLAIVDLTFGQGNGFGIVQHLSQRPQCGTIVVFSAFGTDVIERHCIALGADAVFNKTDVCELTLHVQRLAASASSN